MDTASEFVSDRAVREGMIVGSRDIKSDEGS